MRQFLHVKGLPGPIAAGIGRVIARWSRQEHLQEKALYTILEIGPKEARIALKSARAQEVPSMIWRIAEAKGLTLAEVPGLSNRLEKIENKRNLLAHGVWVRHPDTKTLCVRAASGIFEQTGSTPIPQILQGVSRKMKPQAIPINAAYLREAQKEIMAIRRIYEKIVQEIRRELRRKRQASRKKRG